LPFLPDQAMKRPMNPASGVERDLAAPAQGADAASDIEFARRILSEGAAALHCLEALIGESFAAAVSLILAAPGRLIIGGLGKSGHVGRKLAATFSSTGTPSMFLHLAEALHGDLGGVRPGDVALLISHSGETAELHPIIAFLGEIEVPLIGISSNPNSTLIAASRVPILLPSLQEVCPEGLAPSTSTLMTLAIGDALALTLMRDRGFGAADFYRVHPAGSLGKRLRPVATVMRRGDAVPLVRPETPMLEAVVEMTAKRIGATGVVDDQGRLVGVITDGDLRRSLGRLSGGTAGDVMTPNPKTTRSITTVEDALARCVKHGISVLFVVDDPAFPKPDGVVHIHDLSPRPLSA
jgi:arabinose-5-phosphate isomerase